MITMGKSIRQIWVKLFAHIIIRQFQSTRESKVCQVYKIYMVLLKDPGMAMTKFKAFTSALNSGNLNIQYFNSI